MNVTPIEFAAWIVIGVAVRRLLSELIMAGHNRRERLAVLAEFHDEKTTDQRKQELLARFPETIVQGPDYKYQKIAAEQDRINRPTRGERIRDWSLTLGALVIGWLLYLGAKYGLAFLLALFRDR
jgi:hypothetical protein